MISNLDFFSQYRNTVIMRTLVCSAKDIKFIFTFFYLRAEMWIISIWPDLILWEPNLSNRIMFLATGMSINTLDCKMYMPNRIIDLVYLKQISP